MGSWTASAWGALRASFRWEALPPPPPPEARPEAPGLLLRLLAPEPLPPDLPPAPARRGRWLAWLLAPESLESLDP